MATKKRTSTKKTKSATKKTTTPRSSSTKGKTPVKKTTTRKPAAKREEQQQYQNHRRHLVCILTFGIGLLVTAFAFITGQNIWTGVHNFLFGLFGIPAFFIGPIIMVMAVLSARERTVFSIQQKLWQIIVLFILICGEVQVLSSQQPVGANLGDKLLFCYDTGTQIKGSGLVGGLIGMPLTAAFGKTASAVLLAILIFIVLLILTGATLIGFFRGMAKPVKKLEEGYVQRRELREEGQGSRFDIDVDLGPESMPEHPVASPKRFCVPDIGEEEPKQSRKEKKRKKQEAIPELTTEEISAVPEEAAQLDDLVKKAAVPPEEQPEIKSDPTIGDELSTRLQEDHQNQYKFPPISLLKAHTKSNNRDVSGELRANADRLVDTLKSFGVETRIIDICRGPSVTRYELQPSAGVKISKITNLADDIALNLASGGVRIEAPIPNKAAVGIEVPNKKNDIVMLREIVEDPSFRQAKSPLSFALGKDIAGNPMVADIGKMPHVLIAGSTGSGKSVCINSLIISLIYKSSPDDVRLLMIDPKVVELGIYNGIPHLLVPVVTDPRKAAGALGWAVTEMLNRYKLFADNSVRDINGYNRMAHNSEDVAPLPQIVIIIDELADLMMAASNEVEDSICRLAQMARAAGMHLVIATQRPSVDVITGVIKANIPSRIAFAVSSQVDSRTILDGSGAEKLLGKGDMLFSPVGSQKPTRVQGCFVSDDEVEQVVEFVKSQETADYSDDIIEEIEKQAVAEPQKQNGGGGFDDHDVMLPEAIECVVEAGQASTSFLQRRLKLGYARAARIMDEMEQRGIVGPQEGSKPRQVLLNKQQWIEMNLNQNND
ncbi:DNA translocase FtsK [Massilioclostridium coli]|uniref:DNA translocase FtsK n=1 Tax=Massilioclostridium coli TaxID=1870991 RepID=UPI00085BC046|nr:DNA translocase FtsK [Massilioclostridium coli]